MKKIINKQETKLIAKECKFCKKDINDILDVHRITPGSDGGKYHKCNTVVSCANCHRLVHANKIIIDRWYESTKGPLLHWFDIDGIEHFD